MYPGFIVNGIDGFMLSDHLKDILRIRITLKTGARNMWFTEQFQLEWERFGTQKMHTMELSRTYMHIPINLRNLYTNHFRTQSATLVDSPQPMPLNGSVQDTTPYGYGL